MEKDTITYDQAMEELDQLLNNIKYNIHKNIEESLQQYLKTKNNK